MDRVVFAVKLLGERVEQVVRSDADVVGKLDPNVGHDIPSVQLHVFWSVALCDEILCEFAKPYSRHEWLAIAAKETAKRTNPVPQAISAIRIFVPGRPSTTEE